MNQSSSLLFTPVCGLSLGILASSKGLGMMWGGTLILLSALLFVLISTISKDPVKRFALSKFHYLWFFTLFVGIGIIGYDFGKPYDPGVKRFEDSKYAEGVIKEKNYSTYGDICLVEINHLVDERDGVFILETVTPFKLLLRSDVIENGIDDAIRFPLKIKKVEDSPNLFRTGKAELLRNQGVFYECTTNPEDIILLGHSRSIHGTAQTIKLKLESIIENSGLSTRVSHLLITVLLGDRQYLDSEYREVFSDGGVSHILALSGMHVGIISGIVLWILLPINLTNHFKLRIWLNLAILLIYAFITGLAPSTTRAVLMAAALTICVATERKNNAWNSLLFATFIILLITPQALFDVGFQLSFICVASIIFLVNSFNPVNHRQHPNLYKLISLLLTTLVATGSTWCLTAYYFGTIPSMFLVANLIIIPILPLFIIVSLFHISISLTGISLETTAFILDFVQDKLIYILKFITNESSTALHFHPSGYDVILWLLSIASLILWVKYRNATKIWSKICILCFTSFIVSLIISPRAGYEDGLIIQNKPDSFHVLTRINEKEDLKILNRHAIHELKIKNKKLLFIDSPLFESVRLNENLLADEAYDAIIIGGGIKSDIRTILPNVRTKLIITHPSLRKKREEDIKGVSDSLGINFHSIRYDGPWKLTNNF